MRLVYLFFFLFLTTSATCSETIESYHFTNYFPVLEQPWYFDEAMDIANDKYGNIYLANTNSGSIIKLNSHGYFITQWKLDSHQHFAPLKIEIKHDKIYVLYRRRYADFSHFIRIFTLDGQLLNEFGELRSIVGGSDLVVDDDENIYVVGTNSSEIVRQFDTQSNSYQWVAKPKHKIAKFDLKGNVLGSWDVSETPEGSIKHLLAMDMGSNGYLYLVDREPDQIRRYSVTKEGIQYYDTWNSWERNDLGDRDTFNFPKNLTLDEGNNVYVADRLNNRILKFDENGQFITEWNSRSNQKETTKINRIKQSKFYNLISKLNSLTEIGIDIINRFIKENISANFERFLLKSSLLELFSVQGSEIILNQDALLPVAVSVYQDKAYVIYSYPNNSIVQYTLAQDGATKEQGEHEWRSGSGDERQFNTPLGMTYSKSHLYVADMLNHRVVKRNLASKEDVSIIGKNSLLFPMGIAVDEDGFIYVTNLGNFSVQKFAPQQLDQLIKEWGFLPKAIDNLDMSQLNLDDPLYLLNSFWELEQLANHNTPYQGFIVPSGITVDENYVYVVDSFRASVDVFTKEGVYQYSFGKRGSDVDKFELPFGITVTKDFVFVSDAYRHDIKKFTKSGEFIETWQNGPCNNNSRCHQLDFPLDNPLFISSDKQDYIYVSNVETNQIHKLNSKEHGKLAAIWGEKGSYAGQFGRASGIAATADGTQVYVADATYNRIQSFKTGQYFPKQKAVIIAGRDGDVHYNNAMKVNANQAYWVLRSKGFRKEDIYYIAHNEKSTNTKEKNVDNIDIDGNGLADDINGDLTVENVEYAVTQWATKRNKLSQNDDGYLQGEGNIQQDEHSILIYIISHGIGGKDGDEKEIEGEIVLDNVNLDQNLSYSLVKKVLANLGNNEVNKSSPKINYKIQFIYDACYSGSFKELASENKNVDFVITSSSDEKATFSKQGMTFSTLFWGEILNGQTVRQAFKNAENNINSGQKPNITSKNASSDWEIGTPIDVSKNKLKIEAIHLSPPRVDLSNYNSKLNKKLHLDVQISQSSSLPVDVWVTFIPPEISDENIVSTLNESKPIIGMPNLTLYYTQKDTVYNNNIYKGNYSFNHIKTLKNESIHESGTKYTAKVYARQGNHVISESKTFEIVGDRKFKVLIIENQQELEVEKIYAALSYQGYTLNDIDYLSNSPACDILQCERIQPKKATCGNIKSSLSTSYEDAKFLTIYLSTEFLTRCGTEIMAALDELRRKEIPVFVVYYSTYPNNSKSDTFLKSLSSSSTPMADANRMVLGFYNMKLLHLFWRTIAAGQSLNAAILAIKETGSEFKFDFNGDGVADPKLSDDHLGLTTIKQTSNEVFIGSGVRYAVTKDFGNTRRRAPGSFVGLSTRFYVSHSTAYPKAKFSIEGSQLKQVFIGVMGIPKGQDKPLEPIMAVLDESGQQISGVTNNIFNLQPNATYTVNVFPAPNSPPGIGLIAIYDLDLSPSSSLTSLITTAHVGKQPEDYLYGGFSIRGGPARVILQGIGQGMQKQGIQTNLDAHLILRTFPEGNFIVSNQDWKLNTLIDQKAFEKQVVSKINTSDAAIIYYLQEGDYTLEISGEYNSVGTGQVEMYIVR